MTAVGTFYGTGKDNTCKKGRCLKTTSRAKELQTVTAPLQSVKITDTSKKIRPI